jgi:hypothetical protein
MGKVIKFKIKKKERINHISSINDIAEFLAALKKIRKITESKFNI